METTQASGTTKVTIPCPSCGRLNRIDVSRASDGPKCGACGTPLALDHPLYLTEANFDKVIGGTDLPVLVDFYADWCGPCKMMAPSIDQLAQERNGSALIAKLDTDRAQRTAAGFNIRGIPTVIVFKNGKEAARQTGAVPKAGLEALLKAAGG
jgi:thioredoxin 2